MRLFEIDSINNSNNNNALLQEWQVNDDGGLWQVNNDSGFWQVKDDKSNNNENKVYLLLIRMKMMSHILDNILDHIIVSFVTIELQLLFFLT